MSYFIRMKKQSNDKGNLAGISKNLRALAAFRDDKMLVLQNNLLNNLKCKQLVRYIQATQLGQTFVMRYPHTVFKLQMLYKYQNWCF